MTYYLYHIPGKKIGITKDLKKRVEEQQGYNEGEYDVILQTEDIDIISKAEISLQEAFGYRVDETPYNKLNMAVVMRSNDLWFGFCNAQYQFSKLQHHVWSKLDAGVELGTYFHFAHNLHLYNDKI